MAILYLLVVAVPLGMVAATFVILVVRPYELLFARRRRPRMTPWQVANLIDRAAAGNVDDDEWDDFSSVAIGDSRLDAAANRAVEIVERDRRSGVTPEEAAAGLRAIAQELRASDD